MANSAPKQFTSGMTLMPGQSVTIGVSVPAEVSKIMGSHIFVPVPPPEEAPVQATAESFGLVAGLSVRDNMGGGWRCSCCSKMQTADALLVMVPDSVRRGDSAESVTEACRINAWNGHHSGWCLDCAPKAPKPKLAPVVEIEAARTPAGGWTKATLASWGIAWPPPKGWRKRLISKKVASDAS